MNKERRKALQDVMAQLEKLKEIVEDMQMEEEEAFENLPEGLQESARGEAMEEAAGNLEAAVDDIDTAISDIEEALNA